MFASRGMFDCEKTEQSQMLAMICLSEGRSPTCITQNYHLINGRLARKSSSPLAEFRIRDRTVSMENCNSSRLRHVELSPPWGSDVDS